MDRGAPADRLSSVATWIRHEAAVRILERIVRAMRDAGIEVLPVKGMIAAHTLYDDPADRPMGDIDLRVRPVDFQRAVRVARSEGWAPHDDTPLLWEAGFLVDGWEAEIQGTVGPPGLCAIPVSDAIRRATRTSAPFGFEHLEPELHDHALMLCINVFKDAFRVTPWALEDLVRIAVRPDFDARTFLDRVCEARVATAVWLVADYVHRCRGSSSWRDIQARIGASPPRPRYARWYRSLETGPRRPRLNLFALAAGGDRLIDALPATGLAALGAVRGWTLRRLRAL